MFKVNTMTLMAALVLAACMSGFTATSAQALDRCGGGSNLTQLMKGWKKHGVLDNVARSGHFNPKLDGKKPASFLTRRMMILPTRNAPRVVNDGCGRGNFHRVGVITEPKGSRMATFLPPKIEKKDVSVRPCSGCPRFDFTVKFAYEVTCGNHRRVVTGTLHFTVWLHRAPGKKPPATTKPPTTTPSAGTCVGNNNGGVNNGGVMVTGNCNITIVYMYCSQFGTFVYTADNCNTQITNESCGCTLPPPETCKQGCTPGGCSNNCTTVTCPQGSTYNPTTKKCEKDGTTTPPPITSPPGTNPQPNTGPGQTGSNACYSQTTGAPVVANSDGSCPSGSIGGTTAVPPVTSGSPSGSVCYSDDNPSLTMPAQQPDNICPVGWHH